MIAWWIAQLVLLGGLLALAAYGAESALKVARRQTRWVWLAAMGLTIALGVIAPTRLATTSSAARTWQVTPLPSAATPVTETAGLLTRLSTAWSDATTLLGSQVQRAWSGWHAVMPEGIERTLLIAWAIASLGLLIAFVAVHVRYQRRRAQWPLGDVLGTTVRIAGDTGPAVIGVTSAEIVLPQWLLGRDANEQRLVLEHEMEHVRQHDPVLLALAQGAVILLPWNPAIWWMASRLRLAIELDCDRRVLQRGASARAYGSLLIDLTDHRAGFGAALPAFSCSPSHLERRLVAMTPKRLKYPLVRALSTGAFASLALLAACEAKLPTAEEMDNMTASTATQAAGRVTLVDTAKAFYVIDDRPATKAEAEALPAESIASINVLKKGPLGDGEVHIVTRSASAAAQAKDSGETRIRYRMTEPARVTFRTPGDTFTVVADTLSFERRAPAGLRTELRRADGLRVESTPPGTPANQPARTPFTGLLMIDGVARESNMMNTLSPDRIESVNVIKGAAATAKYTDPRAANGVIEIITKKAKP